MEDMLKLIVLFSRAFANSIVDLFSIRLLAEFFSSITTIDGLVFLAHILIPFYLWFDGSYSFSGDMKLAALSFVAAPFLIRWHLVVCSRTASCRHGLVEQEQLPSRFRLFVWTVLLGLGAVIIVLTGNKFFPERLVLPVMFLALALFGRRPLLRIYLSLYFSRNEIGNLLEGLPVDGKPINRPGFAFLFFAALLLIATLGFYFLIGGLLSNTDFYISNIYFVHRYAMACSLAFWTFVYVFFGLLAANIYQGWVAEFNVDLLATDGNVVEEGVGLDSFADKRIYIREEPQRSFNENVQAVLDGLLDFMSLGLDFCRNIANGDYGLAKTFWGYGVAVNLVLLSVLTVVNAPVLKVILLVVFCCYTVLLMMGVWRSAANFDGPRLWGVLAELVCVFFAFRLAVTLVVSVGAVGQGHTSQPRVPQYITECDERTGDATKQQPDCIGEDKRLHHFPSSAD